MYWTLVTLIMLAVAATYILAVWFFRRMYYVIEEIEARLIQIRDMLEAQTPKDAKKPTARPTPPRTSSHDTAYGR